MELDFRIAYFVFWVSFFVITIAGFYGLPPDFKVEAEYMSGMLTASSILFGFWVMLIQAKPKERTEKWVYEKALSKIFYISVMFLMIPVVSIYFAALNKLSSVGALYSCMVSFLFNALNLMVALYYYKFKEV